MRQHKRVLDLPWKPSVKRAERSNAIDVIASGVLGKEISENSWEQNFLEPVRPLTSVSFFLHIFKRKLVLAVVSLVLKKSLRNHLV